MLVMLALLLISCAQSIPVTKPPVTKVIDTGCSWTGLILISKKDVLSDGTARQILAHNETWEANCDGKGTRDNPPGGG